MMMMGVGNPASSISSSSYCVLIPKTLIPHNLLFKINHTHNLHFHNQTPGTPFTYCRLHARRKDTIAPPPPVVTHVDDDDEYDDEFDDFDDDDVEEDEDEQEFMPFGKMKKWLETKPRGFGEDKVYNTSIEDKLFEEIEQSRLAQAANVNNLKNPNPAAPNKTDHQSKKAPDAIPTGIHVRVVNLPKKKNIHRDLKSAFKDVRGILNIIPAVSGNKKTKDPICKGYAFVDFKLEEDAARFMQQFSRQHIAFGKIQKQIKCEMKNPSSSSSDDDESTDSFSPDIPKADDSFDDPQPTASVIEGELNADLKTDDLFFKETVSDISKSHELDEDREHITETVESLTTLDLSSSDSSESKSKSRMEPATGSLSSKKKDKKRASKKKLIAKGGGQKVPKVDIPGSAKRLKIKEKAVLTDVFTKYGLKATSASTKES